MDFRAPRVTTSKIIQRREGALRVAVVRQSFVIDFAIRIKKSEAVLEFYVLRFNEVATGRSDFLAIVNLVICDFPHGFASVEKIFMASLSVLAPHFRSLETGKYGRWENQTNPENFECGQLRAE